MSDRHCDNFQRSLNYYNTITVISFIIAQCKRNRAKIVLNLTSLAALPQVSSSAILAGTDNMYIKQNEILRVVSVIKL